MFALSCFIGLLLVLAMCAVVEPKITGSIRLNKIRYRKGQEAGLAKAASPEQLQDYQRRGLIEGDWSELQAQAASDATSETESTSTATSDAGSSTTDASGDVSGADRIELAIARISDELGVERNPDESHADFLEKFADSIEGFKTDFASERQEVVDLAQSAEQRAQTAEQEAATLRARVQELESQQTSTPGGEDSGTASSSSTSSENGGTTNGGISGGNSADDAIRNAAAQAGLKADASDNEILKALKPQGVTKADLPRVRGLLAQG